MVGLILGCVAFVAIVSGTVMLELKRRRQNRAKATGTTGQKEAKKSENKRPEDSIF